MSRGVDRVTDRFDSGSCRTMLRPRFCSQHRVDDTIPTVVPHDISNSELDYWNERRICWVSIAIHDYAFLNDLVIMMDMTKVSCIVMTKYESENRGVLPVLLRREGAGWFFLGRPRGA